MQAEERPANMLSCVSHCKKEGRFCAFAGIGCARSVPGSEEESRWRAAGISRARHGINQSAATQPASAELMTFQDLISLQLPQQISDQHSSLLLV